MSRLRAVAEFIRDFVLGDDPLIAALVALGLGLTAALAGAGLAAWWVLPIVVAGALSLSLRRATRG